MIAYAKFSVIPVVGGFVISVMVEIILSIFVEPSEGMSYIVTVVLFIFGISLFKKTKFKRNNYLKLFQEVYEPDPSVYPVTGNFWYFSGQDREIGFIWQIIWTSQSNERIELMRIRLKNTIVLTWGYYSIVIPCANIVDYFWG